VVLKHSDCQYKQDVKLSFNYVGFEVLTAAVMNVDIFWNIALGSHVNRHFGGTRL
jgi:hypothetical protein